MILRDHHPLKGQFLQVLGRTHRGGILHLTLELPDGTRSLIPAAWTDLSLNPAHNSSVTANVSTSPLLGSVSDLLRTGTIVDALLRRLDCTEPVDPELPAATPLDAPVAPITTWRTAPVPVDDSTVADVVSWV